LLTVTQVAKLLMRFIPFLTGNVLFQINPEYSNTEKIVSTAESELPGAQYHWNKLTAAPRTGVAAMFLRIDPGFDLGRLCFKILSTEQGIEACRILQQNGMTTLATAVFGMDQAVRAGEAGCAYIAPYVNELKVHFDSR
jgi:hypothetical protein